MSEFSDRISAQRNILRKVNARRWEKEALLGLSSKAIERWVVVNRIEEKSALVRYVTTAADKLFFLANKSQEQISDEYRMVSEEIEALALAVELEVGA